ncbi:MAG: GFA family protein [Pseudomonadales bacterium]|nr:GFA family protein [Pseudomonadales bacterium]MBO6563563.1 GFA family protein [Pseudomonadales bacterium]MBO6594352.1 GFA family protein [Pseudomonadales bacterium]MBO6655528.1 GFA family protein [Pseudomonadales bacterium]MBO6700853.1 GFA family protein [Pseudomonadales bacterium]
MSLVLTTIHNGACHCGRVRFEFESEPDVKIHECNCSICYRVGFQHLIIPARSFNLLTDWDELALYTFNTELAKHYFCKTCGVKPFYVPRSNPDGISVNFRCVGQSSFGHVTYEPFDGQNWEQNAGALSHLSA